MNLSLYLLVLTLACFPGPILVCAQTYTSCNPLKKTCPLDPAFGASQSFDFTKEISKGWKPVGTVAHDKDGMALAVAKKLDGPLVQSDFYIMFGRVEFTLRAAPGTGIVSSAVLQSDCLDEIDWEWLGGDNAQAQTNYFGKGDLTTYDRGAYHPDPGNHDAFKTYTIDWDSSRILWQINGNTVRTLEEKNAKGQYPQTPCFIKVGSWPGGDPDGAPGTIAWAGGLTDYSKGPYTMHVKTIKVTDYSTGSTYEYTDKSGSWKSIKSNGGSIHGLNPGNAVPSSSPVTSKASKVNTVATTSSACSTSTKSSVAALPSTSVKASSSAVAVSATSAAKSSPTMRPVNSTAPAPIRSSGASGNGLKGYFMTSVLLLAGYVLGLVI
ncbi:concanavalin A-like lectin/glucanase domain-containing protein [Aspergillus avenaceus]|uniref:Crh-like protein n=1 Tax=Aspergillus avenaceus TaxID=36643 RepID=A0A5N6U5W5_ASPAV|nr:concanavalin A-like lectin/glucanase domain-containing protein [Aspergillus avenaceus]